MKPLDTSYTFKRIIETNTALADVFRANYNLYKTQELNSLLVLPDDLIYRCTELPTLEFANPFNVGMQRWSVYNCKLIFRNEVMAGALNTLLEVRAAEGTMFPTDSKYLNGCFEIAGQSSYQNGQESLFRIWPDTFQNIKVFGHEKDADRYVETQRALNVRLR